MAPPRDLQPGDVLGGRYRVIRQLGSGGMGVIYLAEHVALRRFVALKVLRRELIGDDEHVARFEQEARAASAIGHAHIVDVFDLGRCDDGSPYMAMEFLDGMTLADHLAVEGPLPWPRVVELGAQVLSALAAAHNHGIVHRDLKPENIFLVEVAGKALHAKLLDFGISKVLANARLQPTRETAYGTVMGTADYMAPEQARGQTDLVDERTDVYATGVLLYEMFCGRPPFRGESYHAVLSSILERRFVPLATLCPDVPAKLESVVARAIAEDRSHRWQSATDMREALLAAGSGVEATASPPTTLLDGPLEVVELDHWGEGAIGADTRRSTPAHRPSPAPASIAPPAVELVDLPPRRGHEASTLVVHPRRRRQLAPILWLFALLALLTAGAWFLLRPEPPSSPVPGRAHDRRRP